MTRYGTSAIAQDLDTLFGVGAIGSLTDGQLITLCLKADTSSEAAFQLLISRHGPMVWGVCQRVLGNSHDAEDAFQATFLVLLRKAHTVLGQDSLGRWLYGVSLKVSGRARAVATRRRRREVRLLNEPLDREFGKPETRELAHIVDEELGHLPPRFREVVILCDLQGFTQDEAARKLACPSGTIKSRLARGRDRLRSRIARRGYSSLIVLSPSVPTSLELQTVGLLASRTSTGSISVPVTTLTKGVLRTMIMTKLKLAGAAVLAVSCLIGLGGMRLISSARAGDGTPPAKSGEALPEIPPPSADELTAPGLPPEKGVTPEKGLPWETTVRIKVHEPGSIGFASGTVIFSDLTRTQAITTAHHFTKDRPFDAPKPRIIVDLFDGQLSPDRAVTKYTESFSGEVVPLDQDKTLILVEFHPGRQLKVSPTVPASWQPKPGMSVITGGCSEGRDASFWSSKILGTKVFESASEHEMIECQYAPKQGRSGGGLFTSDGHLVGVCNFAYRSDNSGYYVSLAPNVGRLKPKTLSALQPKPSTSRWRPNPNTDDPAYSVAFTSPPRSPGPAASSSETPVSTSQPAGTSRSAGESNPALSEIQGARLELLMMEIQTLTELLKKNNFGFPEDFGAAASDKDVRIAEACQEAKRRLKEAIDELEASGSSLQAPIRPSPATGGGSSSPELEARIRSIEQKLDRLLENKSETKAGRSRPLGP